MAINHVVIVVSYNDIETTKDFINNSKNLNSIDRIIIVDNCSTNELFGAITEFIKEQNIQEKVECIKSEKNGGYSYGNNFGIKYAIKKYNPNLISISNADVILNDRALEACMNYLNEQNNLGFIAPIMITPQKDTVKSYWVLPTYGMLLISNFILFLSVIRKLEKSSFEKKGNLIYAGCINGSFFMGKPDTFVNINYLDEDVFLYDEEAILGRKIEKAGLRNAIVSNEYYIHKHKGSIELNIHSKKRRFQILHESHVIYLTKYLNISSAQLLLFNATYVIGLESYLVYAKIREIFSRRGKKRWKEK